MTYVAVHSEPVPIHLELGSALELSDDELFELCVRNPHLRMERTAGGDLIVMTPTGWASGRRGAEVVGALRNWAREEGSGVVSDASAGFLLPNGAMRAPDAAWVLRSRLDEVPPEVRERFLPLCPDFVVEIKSPSDRTGDLRAKMEEYRDNGARLGWRSTREHGRSTSTGRDGRSRCSTTRPRSPAIRSSRGSSSTSGPSGSSPSAQQQPPCGVQADSGSDQRVDQVSIGRSQLSARLP